MKWYKYVTWILVEDDDAAAELTQSRQELGGGCYLASAVAQVPGVEMVDGTALFAEERHRSAPMNGENGGTWRA